MSVVADQQPGHQHVTTMPPAREVRLLGGFELRRSGQPVVLPAPAQRLVAFLATRSAWVSRSQVAGSLWLDSTQQRALGSLRSAVWRTRNTDSGLLEVSGDGFRLADTVRVDAREATSRAHRMLDDLSGCREDELSAEDLTEELLPHWFDDWILLERERLRQLFLHALEALTHHLSELGRHARAIDIGTIVVQQEPMRESAHRALIEAYLAEGNRNEAVRQFHVYRDLMRRELGLGPSPRLERILTEGLGVERAVPGKTADRMAGRAGR
jgi:DNA-binding SARP family transcriptional activator